jgi:hypothetical protein
MAKRNLSNSDENSVISFLTEISLRLNGLSTPFYTPNIEHANFSVKTFPADRKTQTFKFRRKLCYFFPARDISAFKRSFHSILHTERRSTTITASKQSLQIAKRKLSELDDNIVISFLIEIFRSLSALPTPFYTSKVAHANFRVQTETANRKAQTFTYRRKLRYFVPD